MHRKGIDRENVSFSQQNILANSIRIARQKFGKGDRLEDVKQTHEKDESYQPHNKTYSFMKQKKQNSAAQAIKILQTRVSELEAFNQTLTKQSHHLKQQSRIKNQTIQQLKQQYQKLSKELVTCRQNIARLESNFRVKERRIQQLQSSIKSRENQHKIKVQSKDKQILDLTETKEILQQKVAELNKRIDNNQKVIVHMIKQIEDQKSHRRFSSPNVYTNSSNKYKVKEKQSQNFPVIVDEPEDETSEQFLKENRMEVKSSKKRRQEGKRKGNVTSMKKGEKSLQILNKQLQEKNKELYNMVRTTDRKFKQQQKAKNQYKQKFYNLKNATDSIVEEISRLPQHLAYKFKCLVVRVKKIQNDNIECLRSYSLIHGSKFNCRSSRHSSKQSSAPSKSRGKKLKMQDLNLSDQMSQPRSQSKSRSRGRKSLGNYLRSHSGKKQIKSVIVQQNEQTETMKALGRRIREQRKQLCEMYKRMEKQSDDEKKTKLKNEFEQKMQKNTQLQSELERLKKTRV